MALSGLGLSLFVLTHMIGNLLLFVGPEAYNTYSHALITSKLIYIAEAGLAGLFLAHAFVGICLARENRAARPQKYAVTTNGEKTVSFASKTMVYHGLILLVFTIHHLITFKYGTVYTATYNGVEMRDLFRLVTEVFQSPVYVIWYAVALVLLALHLSHGFASSFQSIGFNHPSHTPKIKCFGYFYAVVVTLGFIAPPIAIFFR